MIPYSYLTYKENDYYVNHLFLSFLEGIKKKSRLEYPQRPPKMIGETTVGSTIEEKKISFLISVLLRSMGLSVEFKY